MTHSVITLNVHLSAAGSDELSCDGFYRTVSNLCLSGRIQPSTHTQKHNTHTETQHNTTQQECFHLRNQKHTASSHITDGCYLTVMESLMQQVDPQTSGGETVSEDKPPAVT